MKQGTSGVTNLNTIPTSLIDHIEILQDGASAVYGSDAISGVVNIITVKNFRGAEAHAYYGIHNDHQTGRWDGQTKQYDFTLGGGNDRGNVVFNATYREQNLVWNRNRLDRRTAVVGEPPYVNAYQGTPKGRFQFYGPAVSGRTIGQGTCATYDPKTPTSILCDLTLQNAPAQPSTQNFRNFKNTDRYDWTKERHLQEGLKDVTTFVQGHYDLSNNVTFSANAAYIREETFEVREHESIQAGLFSNKTANGSRFGIAASNPYNPFGVALVADSTAPCLAAGNCIGVAHINRLILENHQRHFRFNRDYFHIFAGFNGFINLFNREIDWDVGFAQNRLQGLRISNYTYNMTHVKKALGPASQCTSPCVPLDLFGGSTLKGDNGTPTYGGSVTGPNGGSISPAQVNYVEHEMHNIRQSNLRDWSANISSNVYNLPAGPLGLAIGWERIDNYGYYHPDSVDVAGNDSDDFSSATHGRVVRNAEYAELNIPLLADVPGAKSLSVDIANRWTQFKRTGGFRGPSGRTNQAPSFVHNSSGRLNIRWQVINDLLLRASWSQGFRSPNINELYGGQGIGFPVISDPCAPVPTGGYRGGPLPPNCPNGTLDVQPGSNISNTNGSNPNLGPEKSLSRTVGFVYSPSQVPGLDVNADYFKIEINNAVGTIGNQSILSGCFESFSFCNLLTVRGNQVTDISNVLTNVGGLLTEGIDVGLHYKFPSTPIGDFDARINGTFLKAFDSTVVNRATKTGFATSHLAGVIGYPKRRFNGYLDWDYGNWSAHYRIEYIDSSVDRCSVAVEGYCTYPDRTTDYQGAPGQFTLGRQHIGATVYHDVNIAYQVPAVNTTFSLGVDNLFDKKPPITGGGGIDLAFYRLPSRLVYGSIRVRF